LSFSLLASVCKGRVANSVYSSGVCSMEVEANNPALSGLQQPQQA